MCDLKKKQSGGRMNGSAKVMMVWGGKVEENSNLITKFLI